MSLKFAFFQFLIAALIIAGALSHRGPLPFGGILSAYCAWSFFFVGCGYAGWGPGIFGKSPDGTLSRWRMALIGPFHFFNRLVWYSWRAMSSNVAFGELSPGLWFGRRMTTRDVKRVILPELYGVLDLTAEFTEPRGLRELPGYRCLPILDATGPSIDQLLDAAQWLHRTSAIGTVYVHCAQGYGRTGAVLVAYLLLVEGMDDVDDAVERLRQVRSGVHLNRVQRQILVSLQADLARYRAALAGLEIQQVLAAN